MGKGSRRGNGPSRAEPDGRTGRKGGGRNGDPGVIRNHTKKADSHWRENFTKVKGTRIEYLSDGRPIRYVPESGKTFSPNDLDGVYAHLDKLAARGAATDIAIYQPLPWRDGKGTGKGKSKGKGSSAARESSDGRKGKSKGGGKDFDARMQYERIAGTRIEEHDGQVVRVVRESGRVFAPNDLQSVYGHLDYLQQMRSEEQYEGSWKLQYEVVERTKIKMMDGEVVRVARDSGKVFAPNDIAGVYAHLDKLARDATDSDAAGTRSGKGKSKGGKKSEQAMMALPSSKVKKKHLKKDVKELGRFAKKAAKKQAKTSEANSEKLEALRAKIAEKHAARAEKHGRQLISSQLYEGEVVRRARLMAWVKPSDLTSFPADVERKIIAMNDEIRSKLESDSENKGKKKSAFSADHDLIFASVHDIEEKGLLLKKGKKIKFKVYTDSKGVGACDIVAA